MNYILLCISTLSVVLQNCVHNTISKQKLRSKYDVFFFNSMTYVVCFVAFALLTFGTRVSSYSILLGILFGVLTMMANFCKLTALSKGSMHITILVTTSSMVIPTFWGALMFHEGISAPKACALFVLIFFIYLTLKKSGASQHTRAWVFACILAFLFQGGIGVVQKIHQSSAHRDELSVFLASSFLFSCIFSRCLARDRFEKGSFGKREYLFSAVCGVCTFTMNYINLKLAGLLPSQVFFPLANGGSIIMTSIASIVLFKEKPDRTQTIGLIGGIISLILICLF